MNKGNLTWTITHYSPITDVWQCFNRKFNIWLTVSWMVHGQQSLQQYKVHIRLETRIFNPWAIDNMVIILHCTGWLGTSANMKNRHSIASVIFICRYAESFPKQILGPACTNDTQCQSLTMLLACYMEILVVMIVSIPGKLWTWMARHFAGFRPQTIARAWKIRHQAPSCKPFFPLSMGHKLLALLLSSWFHQATHHPLVFL